jgi:hypothetical protein
MSATSVAPTQDDITTLLRSFLIDVLPDGTDVILGQINRVPEPRGGQFVVMTPVHILRLGTNFDESGDVKFQGSIAGQIMTVTSFSPTSKGTIDVGSPVFGVGVADGTKVTERISGAGETGTYQVSPSQTIGSEVLSAGRWSATQPAQWTIQLDFHGADTTAADMAQTVSTLFRDEYATKYFEQRSSSIAPFYADDPRQMPFINDQQQYEWRWIVSAVMQVNQKVLVPMQYADAAEVGLIEVDGRYPP